MISLITCEFSTKSTPSLCEIIQNPKTFGFSIAKSKWIWYNNYGNTKGNRKTTPKRCIFFEEISVYVMWQFHYTLFLPFCQLP